jgi:hypothetical protein
MFVPSGSGHIPYPRFRAAIDAGDLEFIRRHSEEFAPVRLSDALQICLLLRDQHPERFERAAVRWLGRFALEARKATIEDVRLAASALDSLAANPNSAMERLSALCVRHQLTA